MLALWGCGSDVVPAPPPPPSSPAPPELLFELAIDHTAERMQALSDAIPQEQLRAVLPPTASDWMDVVAGLPPEAVRAIDDDAPVRALALFDGREAPVLAVATRVRSTEGLPLRVDPGLAHARWVGAAPGEGEPAVALAGDVIVAAEDRASLERALPYLATRAMAERVAAGVRLRLPEGATARVRTELDRLIEEGAQGALRSAREERGAHDEAPSLGEPEALVALVRDMLMGWTAHVPDARSLTLSVEPDGDGLVLVIDVSVRDGSPLARELAAARSVHPRALSELPRGTALAWIDASTAAEREEDAAERARALRRVAGDRLPPVEAEALTEMLAAWGRARGDTSITALGRSGETPFVLVRTPAGAPLDAALFSRALRGAYASRALATLLGCERAGEGDFVAAPSSPAPSLLPLCAEPVTTLELSERDATRTLSLYRGPALASARLGDSPDVARARPDREVVWAALVVPSRLWSSASVLGHPALERLASAPGTRVRDAPIALDVERRERGLRLRVTASRLAVSDLVVTLAPLFESE